MGSNPVRDAILIHHIRFMIICPTVLSDAKNISLLHAACFEHAWNTDYFQHVLSDNRYLCIKIKDESDTIGFCLCLNIQPEIEILSICVRKEDRRMGYGRKLLEYLIANYSFEKIFLEVSKNNHVAIKLYEAVGFIKISERRGYYHENNENVDALIYQFAR